MWSKKMVPLLDEQLVMIGLKGGPRGKLYTWGNVSGSSAVYQLLSTLAETII